MKNLEKDKTVVRQFKDGSSNFWCDGVHYNMKDQIQTLIQEHKERLVELSLFLNDISAIKNKNVSIEEQRLITETINELELEKSLRLSFISDLENLC